MENAQKVYSLAAEAALLYRRAQEVLEEISLTTGYSSFVLDMVIEDNAHSQDMLDRLMRDVAHDYITQK